MDGCRQDLLFDWHLNRTAALESDLKRLKVEDFVVENGDRPTSEVALEMLAVAGWIDVPDRPPEGIE
jgi:hypothetical protein